MTLFPAGTGRKLKGNLILMALGVHLGCLFSLYYLPQVTEEMLPRVLASRSPEATLMS